MTCRKSLKLRISNTTLKARDERIDAVKYWLIVIVVAGHILKRDEFLEIHECDILSRWIYFFHMPLFIFLSGFFSRKKDRKDFPASIWKLLEPLIIFQVLGLVLFNSLSFSIILNPWFVLWYLYCLIYWRLMIQIIPDKILNNTKLIVITSLCVGIAANYIPFNEFLSIHNTFYFMPYFFLGYCMRGKNLFLPNKYKPLCFIFLLLTLIIPTFFSQELVGLTPSKPYVIILTYGLILLVSVAFINICPVTSWIAKQGRLTLQYFIFHAFLLRLLTMMMVKFNFPVSLFAAAIYTIAIIIILGIASYIPYFDKLTNPSSFYMK